MHPGAGARTAKREGRSPSAPGYEGPDALASRFRASDLGYIGIMERNMETMGIKRII